MHPVAVDIGADIYSVCENLPATPTFFTTPTIVLMHLLQVCLLLFRQQKGVGS